MRVFLAFPFGKYLDRSTGVMDPESTGLLSSLILGLQECGHSVFSAQVRETFGKDLMDPSVCTPLDFLEMRNADVVLAIPGSFPCSGGVMVELGWASSLNKPVFAVLDRGETYSALLMGLHTLTRVEQLYYSGSIEVADVLERFHRFVSEISQTPLRSAHQPTGVQSPLLTENMDSSD